MKALLTIIVFSCICVEVFPQHNLSCKNAFHISETEKQHFKNSLSAKAKSYASLNFTVYYYSCEWKIDPAVRYIDGAVTSGFIITSATDNIIYDFTNELIIDSIMFHTNKAEYIQSANNTLTINFGETLSSGMRDSLAIYYHGIPPVSQDFTGGFIQSSHNNVPVIWTLSEPYNAKNWWPCRNGLDDKADSMDIYIIHPSQYKASSNGTLLSESINNSSTTTHYKHSYPIASYLVALAVTNYSTFTNSVIIDDTTLSVINYVYPESLTEFQSSSATVLHALKLYSDSLGNYPFLQEKYGQTQFSWGGGMEHQTNSFVVSTGQNLLTHELAHQWFGDKVTCSSWHDIWLNEGFATYMADFFYTENFDTAAYSRNVINDLNYVVSQPGGSVYVDDTTNINRIFDGRLSYDKGAFLLRMLRYTLGDKIFFEGLRKYLSDANLAYNFAGTDNFKQTMEDVSGTNLDYFFNQWFYGAGYPSITINWYQAPDGTINIRARQTTSDSSVKFFTIKLPLLLQNGSKKENVLFEFSENNQYVVLPNPGFGVDEILIDPDHYFISNNNTVFEVPFIDESGD